MHPVTASRLSSTVSSVRSVVLGGNTNNRANNNNANRWRARA